MSCILSAVTSVILVAPLASPPEPVVPWVVTQPPAPDATSLPPGAPKFPWKTGIVSTVFWVGEQPTQNNPVPNTMSSWDTRWMSNFGGYDDPNPGNRDASFLPAGFRPKENPFYVALPYNDILNSRVTKAEAANIIPWFKEAFRRPGKSVCHNRWLALHHRGRVCFAQWSDCGPFTTQDADYVFGSARPSNTKNQGAGIDVSPAVRDFLQMPSGSKCDWRFVELSEVSEGPWKQHGTNNPFATDRAGPADTPVLAGNERAKPVFTAVYKVSSTRPVGKATKRAVEPASSATAPRSKATGVSRLEELRRAREQWIGKE